MNPALSVVSTRDSLIGVEDLNTAGVVGGQIFWPITVIRVAYPVLVTTKELKGTYEGP